MYILEHSWTNLSKPKDIRSYGRLTAFGWPDPGFVANMQWHLVDRCCHVIICRLTNLIIHFVVFILHVLLVACIYGFGNAFWRFTLLVQARRQLSELIWKVGPETLLYLRIWTLQKDWQLTGSTVGYTGLTKGVCIGKLRGLGDASHAG